MNRPLSLELTIQFNILVFYFGQRVWNKSSVGYLASTQTSIFRTIGTVANCYTTKQWRRKGGEQFPTWLKQCSGFKFLSVLYRKCSLNLIGINKVLRLNVEQDLYLATAVSVVPGTTHSLCKLFRTHRQYQTDI